MSLHSKEPGRSSLCSQSVERTVHGYMRDLQGYQQPGTSSISPSVKRVTSLWTLSSLIHSSPSSSSLSFSSFPATAITFGEEDKRTDSARDSSSASSSADKQPGNGSKAHRKRARHEGAEDEEASQLRPFLHRSTLERATLKEEKSQTEMETGIKELGRAQEEVRAAKNKDKQAEKVPGAQAVTSDRNREQAAPEKGTNEAQKPCKECGRVSVAHLPPNKRWCSVAGCAKYRVQAGVCIAHGARRLCRAADCFTRAERGVYCPLHKRPRIERKVAQKGTLPKKQREIAQESEKRTIALSSSSGGHPEHEKKKGQHSILSAFQRQRYTLHQQPLGEREDSGGTPRERQRRPSQAAPAKRSSSALLRASREERERREGNSSEKSSNSSVELINLASDSSEDDSTGSTTETEDEYEERGRVIAQLDHDLLGDDSEEDQNTVRAPLLVRLEEQKETGEEAKQTAIDEKDRINKATDVPPTSTDEMKRFETERETTLQGQMSFSLSREQEKRTETKLHCGRRKERAQRWPMTSIQAGLWLET